MVANFEMVGKGNKEARALLFQNNVTRGTFTHRSVTGF